MLLGSDKPEPCILHFVLSESNLPCHCTAVFCHRAVVLEGWLVDGRLALAFGLWYFGSGFWYLLLLKAWLWLLLFGCCFGGLVD